MDDRHVGTGGRRHGTAAWLAVLALGLVGCLQEGPEGDPGPPGPPGVVLTGDPAVVEVEIISVGVTGGQPVVAFRVTDDDGIAYASVASTAVRFTFAKLIPGANGDASAWQSYVNRLETPTVGPGVTPKVQATTDSGGVFVNHGDGTYTYTFGTNVTAVTTPLAVAYEPAATHRLGMSLNIGGGVEAVNAVHDFVPQSGATTTSTREIVATATCNECHGRLAIHGGSRVETRFCVTCHNPGTTDANSGNSLDFKVMVHKIHQGADLPSVLAGGAYSIYGYGNTLHDYSTVHLPQDTTNCTKCHDAADAATPQGGQWASVPTLQACGSCHDDVDFAAGVAGGHDGGAVTSNADCTVCHQTGAVAGSVAESHTDPVLAEATKYKFNLISVANTGPGQFPQVTYSVTNPLTGAAYALTDSPVANGSLTARMAWDTRDYHNTGTATTTSAPASAASLSLLTSATNNGNGTYTKTFTFAVPASATGSLAMALEGRMGVDVQGVTWRSAPDGVRERIPVEAVVKYYPITDSSAVARRAIVETDRCQNCHGTLNGLVLHGNSRSDNNELCVMCHNPDNTDLAQRPVDPDGVNDGDNAAAIDGLEEASIDMRTMIHSIHAGDMRTNPYAVYGFGATAYDFSEVVFPGRLERCETCHLPNTYYPASDTSERLGVTLSTGATVTQRSPSVVLSPAGASQDHADDENVTPVAAACRGCHDGALARTHMELNGSLFNALQSTLTGNTPETCAICHGAGRAADVKVVHGFGD